MDWTSSLVASPAGQTSLPPWPLTRTPHPSWLLCTPSDLTFCNYFNLFTRPSIIRCPNYITSFHNFPPVFVWHSLTHPPLFNESHFTSFCITAEEGPWTETFFNPVKLMLCYKLNNLPIHHHHTAMNLYKIMCYVVILNVNRYKLSIDKPRDPYPSTGWLHKTRRKRVWPRETIV